MAVSSLHEGLIELVRKRPRVAADLATHFLGIAVPSSAQARLSESTLNEALPAEYYADAAVVMDLNGAAVLGVIIEAQLGTDERKRYTWPHYATSARARHECSFVVMVVAPDPRVARWAREPIDLGYGSVFQPHVIGPEQVPQVTESDQAERDLPVAALSVTAHGKGDPATAVKIALALARAAKVRDNENLLLYLGLIENALSAAAKEILSMMPDAPKYFSESQRRSYDKGAAHGKIEGMVEAAAKAVLRVLARRGLRVSDDQASRIRACTDLETLDRWLDSALSVASVDELLG
jgi:hypothetical protein